MHVEMSALVELTNEKGIPLEQLIQAIEVGVLTAYNQTDDAKRHAHAVLNRESGEIQILIPQFNEIGEKIGDEQDMPEGFSRVATSTARQVIKMKMRETNDASIVAEFTANVGDVISGVVQQGRDPKMILVNLGRFEGRIHRTKIAVRSHRAGVSPKGSLIGPMGARARAVMDELHGEKIDIVDWSEDPATFVGHSLAPAKVASVQITDLAGRSAKVVVPDYQLSLAIGKDGQNARLAARLTGWRIDIHPDNPIEA